MVRCISRRVLLVLAVAIAPSVGVCSQRMLTRAIDVRSLSPAEADLNIETRLTGIVIYVSQPHVIMQDNTGSTFFQTPHEMKLGDEVEVNGKTRMGLYMPGIGKADVRVIRHGMPLPTTPAGYEDIVSARYYYQRVAVEGIVRSIEQKKDWRLLRLAMGSKILDVRIDQMPPAGDGLIDSRVRIEGISAGSINDRRQVVDIFIRMSSADDILVLDPPLPSTSVPRVSASELLAFHPSGRGERRIGVAGIVTAVFQDRVIYLQDGEVAFVAALSRPTALSLGDRVELLGFAEITQFTASVIDAEVYRRESGEPLQPVACALDSLDSSYNARFVSLEASVLKAIQAPTSYTLVLVDQTRTIQVHVQDGKNPPEAGALVRVKGICHVEPAPTPKFSQRPGAVYMRVSSPGDVQILKMPLLWTVRKLVGVLGILSGITVLVIVWNLALHRRARQKAEELRESIESEAALQERQRIAHEFHDSLQQDLTGLGLRLDAVATLAFDEEGRQIIHASRNLLARIEAETKNIVSDLRDSASFDTDLATALEEIADRCAMEAGVEVKLELATRPSMLPSEELHHLRMIARESINNVLRHANATRIEIYLAVLENRLVMSISDDGLGFDSDTDTRGKPGHFGCVGMRERARKIGATITWRSVRGRGTTVDVKMALKASAKSSAETRVGAFAGDSRESSCQESKLRAD